MSFYWHYSTRHTFEVAVGTGAIGAGLIADQLEDFILFSPETDWAPTTLVTDGFGAMRCATYAESCARGLYRFGLPASQLLPAGAALRRSGVPPAVTHALDEAIRQAGADLTQWLALVGKLNVFEAVIDRVRDGRWQRIKRMRLVARCGLVALVEEPLQVSVLPPRENHS